MTGGTLRPRPLRIIAPGKIQDNERAVNGLQVENCGHVRCFAAMVDASPATVKLAIAAGADLMIVHPGLFWSPPQPRAMIRQRIFRRVSSLWH